MNKQTHREYEQRESPWQDEDTLRELYHGEGLSQKEVADRLGCSRETVLSWMNKLGVDSRGPNETRYVDQRRHLQQNEDEIVARYKGGEPLYSLAPDFDVNDQTLRRYLNKVGVETRGLSDQLKKSFSTDRVEELDTDVKTELRDAEYLRGLHIEQKKSTRQIGRELGCSGSTVLRWLRKHGINVRDRPKAIEYSRRGNPKIRTGVSGYEFIRHANCNVRHHRLLATLLVDDISELDDMHIHHMSGVEWDNRLSNLEVLDFRDHMAQHNGGKDE